MNTFVASMRGPGQQRVTPAVVLTGLALLLLASVLFGLFSGAVTLSPSQIAAALGALITGKEQIDPMLAVITVIRLPRLLLAMLVGAVLAVSGAAMQGLFRNPLADPALIGVSSGASLGAVAVIVLGSWLPLLAGRWRCRSPRDWAAWPRR